MNRLVEVSCRFATGAKFAWDIGKWPMLVWAVCVEWSYLNWWQILGSCFLAPATQLILFGILIYGHMWRHPYLIGMAVLFGVCFSSGLWSALPSRQRSVKVRVLSSN